MTPFTQTHKFYVLRKVTSAKVTAMHAVYLFRYLVRAI